MHDIRRTKDLIEAGIESGEHTGAQVYVSRSGETLVDQAFGYARPEVPLTSDSLMLWLSSGKPIGAAAILQLVEAGLLNLDGPVAQIIPEFAAGGKELVTIRHLLTHTGGFRWIDLGWPQTSWAEIIERICKAKLERGWIPGEKAGYHPFTSWYILGEVVERISGESFSNYVRGHIFEPLGMLDSWIGMPENRYDIYGDRLAQMADTEKPSDVTSALHGAWPLHRYATRQGVTDCIPGGNGHGPARELAKFYEMLLSGGDLDGAQILSSASVKLMSTRQRTGVRDETFKHVIDWGLGTIINSAHYGVATVPYGYGPHASRDTYGHSGSQSSAAFADPERNLVVVVIFNGTPGEPRHQARMRATLTALYEDLGLS